MPLKNVHYTPPGGFKYREPSINWVVPDPMLPFGMVVEQLQIARAQNPHANLDPSFAACAKAIEDYTVARLHGDPEWCIPDPVSPAASSPPPKVKVGRACCGHRRR